jgi:transcriptional regulator with XRE-family HTH domain
MNRLKALRTELGLTQLKLSMDLHVSQQYISKVENGNSLLTEDLILHLANYFHVSTGYFLGISDIRSLEYTHSCSDYTFDKWVTSYYTLNETNRELILHLIDSLIELQERTNS